LCRIKSGGKNFQKCVEGKGGFRRKEPGDRAMRKAEWFLQGKTAYYHSREEAKSPRVFRKSSGNRVWGNSLERKVDLKFDIVLFGLKPGYKLVD